MNINEIIENLEDNYILDEFSKYLFSSLDDGIKRKILSTIINHTVTKDGDGVFIDFDCLGREEAFVIVINHKWFIKQVYNQDRNLFEKLYNQFLNQQEII